MECIVFERLIDDKNNIIIIMLFSEGESNRNCMHYKFNKMYKS